MGHSIDVHQDRSCFVHYVEGVIYQALTNNKRRKEEKNLNKKEQKDRR
jgi:hypothetical protein